jgi:hypothetical protein
MSDERREPDSNNAAVNLLAARLLELKEERDRQLE